MVIIRLNENGQFYYKENELQVSYNTNDEPALETLLKQLKSDLLAFFKSQKGTEIEQIKQQKIQEIENQINELENKKTEINNMEL